ncbi:MAG: lysophospholipid acyltransferase family protein [Bdellovibrionia bacterium]
MGLVGGHRLGPFLLKTLGYGFGLQPRMIQRFLGKALGWCLMVCRFRTQVVRANLSYAYPNDPHQQKKVFRQSFEHLGNLFLEILMLFGPMRRFIVNFVDVKGLEHIQEAQRLGKGMILLSSHVGNWEVMAGAAGVFSEMKLMLVTKALKPGWLHEAILQARLRLGVRATYEPKTMREVLSHLKSNGAVGFVLDQYAGPPVGVRVPLFGVPVGTSLALATLVRRTEVPVLPVVNFRKPCGRWQVSVGAPLSWQKHESLHEELAFNTAAYVQFVEKCIREHPEQWLWIHRRFKGDLSPLRQGEWSDARVRK